MTTQRDGVILQANRAALALLRCDDPGKFIGQPGISWIAPHAIPALVALHTRRPRRACAPATFETVGLRFDGTEFPVRVQRSTIHLPDGPATVGSYTDLTDENRVEAERTALVEELRLSRHHLDEAQRIGHIGSWEQEFPSGPLWFSDESCRIFGLEPGAFAGTVDAFLACVHPDDRAGVAPLLDPIPLNIQYRIVRPDGSVRIIHDIGELVRDPDGVPLRFVGTLQDITDRVTVEAERARLATAVEQTADSIWMQDLDNVVTYVNPSFSRIYGYDPTEIVGHHARMVDSGEHELAFFNDLWATARAGNIWTGSLINRRKDGTTFEVEAVISGLTDADGPGHRLHADRPGRDPGARPRDRPRARSA